MEHACGSGDGALRNVLCNIPELAHKMIMMIYGAVQPVLKVMFAFTWLMMASGCSRGGKFSVNKPRPNLEMGSFLDLIKLSHDNVELHSNISQSEVASS